jgi:hypothetical protein
VLTAHAGERAGVAVAALTRIGGGGVQGDQSRVAATEDGQTRARADSPNGMEANVDPQRGTAGKMPVKAGGVRRQWRGSAKGQVAGAIYFQKAL